VIAAPTRIALPLWRWWPRSRGSRDTGFDPGPATPGRGGDAGAVTVEAAARGALLALGAAAALGLAHGVVPLVVGRPALLLGVVAVAAPARGWDPSGPTAGAPLGVGRAPRPAMEPEASRPADQAEHPEHAEPLGVRRGGSGCRRGR
jgi:hypothetical protein